MPTITYEKKDGKLRKIFDYDPAEIEAMKTEKAQLEKEVDFLTAERAEAVVEAQKTHVEAITEIEVKIAAIESELGKAEEVGINIA